MNKLVYVIGIDLGGTNLKVGAVSSDGKILFRLSVSSDIKDGKDATIKRILHSIEEARFNVRGLRLAGIGFGFPGLISPNGVISNAPNLPDWEGASLKNELADKLSAPLFFDNDANLFALGEGWLGVAKDAKSFCCLTLGTGVGGGIVLDGNLWHGADGMAAEIGHIIVEPDGVSCMCGGRGCLEMYASASALVRMAKEGVGDGSSVPPSADAIAQLARSGDPYYRGIFNKLARYLGIGITDLVNLLNIDMIVIGGGLSQSSDLFLESARKEMRKRAFKVPADRVRVVPAQLGDDAGIVGAAFLALNLEHQIKEDQRNPT